MRLVDWLKPCRGFLARRLSKRSLLRRGGAAARRRSMGTVEYFEKRELLSSAPVADDAARNMHFNTSASGSFPATDEDADPLTFDIVDDPAHGSVSWDSYGYVYTPVPNFVGTDAFTFIANDGLDDSNVATITINVEDVAPVAYDSTINTHFNTPASVSFSAWDSDGDTLSFTIVEAPTHGSVSGDVLFGYVYTPNPNFVGADSFTFTANDGFAESGNATITIEVGNTAPVAYGDSLGTHFNSTLMGSFYAVDGDYDSLIASIVSGPASGSVSVDAYGYQYVPATSFVGTDSFTYRVNDGVADSNVATITISVGNTAPLAYGGSFETPLNSSLSGSFSAWDADSDSLTVNVVGGPASGSLSVDSYGFVYVPTTDFVGTDSFTFTVNDGATDSNVATITFNVTNGDEPPPPSPTVSLSSSALTVTESGTATFTVTRTGDVSAALVVSFANLDNATLGSDYTLSATGSVTILAGQSSATITLSAINDSQDEPNETATLILSAPAGYSLGSGSQTVTILDDDIPPPVPMVSFSSSELFVRESEAVVITVSRTGDLTNSLTVAFATTGAAALGDDYMLTSLDSVTIPAGAVSGTITLTATDDGLAESGRNRDADPARARRLFVADRDNQRHTVAE